MAILNIPTSVTIPSSSWMNNNMSITSGTMVDTISTTNIDSTYVTIGEHGMTLQPSCDITIGDRSLKDFMDKVEERLNILRVNQQLEDKWEQLAELGRQYRELEKELLEKERMWKILKDSK